MEKLIESLQEKIVMKDIFDEEGKQAYAGLTIRFSGKHNLWLCGYGVSIRASSKMVGTGYSIVEAVDDFITRFPQFKKDERK